MRFLSSAYIGLILGIVAVTLDFDGIEKAFIRCISSEDTFRRGI